jgi:hypothetical protein
MVWWVREISGRWMRSFSSYFGEAYAVADYGINEKKFKNEASEPRAVRR